MALEMRVIRSGWKPCRRCQGEGWDDDGGLCPWCSGSGDDDLAQRPDGDPQENR